MRGAMPPLFQCAFMAWCSLKAQVRLYLTLPYKSVIAYTNIFSYPEFYSVKLAELAWNSVLKTWRYYGRT